ncbi:MAG: calcium-binding protein [Chloroflexota bacterium]
MSRRDIFKVGQTVRINDGIKDDEFDVDIGGWQGSIIELDPNEKMMLIAFDSITLRDMGLDYIEQCEEEGMDWAQYYIGYDDVTLAAARDTAADVENAAAELAAQAGWAYLGEEGRAINAVLAGIDIEDELGQMVAWRDNFEKCLTFPFKAVVDEAQHGRSPVRAGDRVKVLALAEADDLYGVIVRVKHKFSTFSLPLCDLKALDEASANYEPVYLYALWFANR